MYVKNYYKSNYWSHINNLTINNYSFNNNKDSIIFNEKVNIKAKDYAIFSGDRMLFTINAFNRYTSIPKRYRNRKLPLEISRGFLDFDNYNITLPSNYTIEAIAEDVKLENEFGNYQISIKKISDDKLQYSRTLFIKNGTYTSQHYKKYRNFRKQISKYDKTKIVLIKKQ